MSKRRAMLLGLDGADPVVVKRMIAEGRLPNLKKIMDEGAHTENLDMLGVFPTVTPPNWTTLATGNYPITHGITCFQNSTEGRLGISEMNWDSRRIESELIWEAFEDEGKRCIMFNYCQAWPNRVKGSKNIFVDGTGMVPFLRSSAEFQKYVYLDESIEELKEIPHNVRQSSGDCVVYGDQAEKMDKVASEDLESQAAGYHFQAGEFDESTPMLEAPSYVMMDESVEEAANGDVIDRLYSPLKEAKNWGFEVPEDAKEGVYVFNNGLLRRPVLVVTNEQGDYDTIRLYKNKRTEQPLGEAKVGEWSDWIYDLIVDEDEDKHIAYKIRVVDVEADGSKASFYVSHAINLDNHTYLYPQSLGDELFSKIGPMMYFGTFYRHTDVGDKVVVETWEQNHKWQAEATKYLLDKYDDWQLYYIHLHSIDLVNHWYINQAIPGSHPDWQRHKAAIERVYEINDAFIGEMLEYLDDNTSIFIVSDHGATPRSVGYDNPGIGELSGINCKVMSELGYTKVNAIDAEKGLWEIDWSQTKAVNNRTSYININLKGREPQGIVEPEEYDALVQQIISDLYDYRDPVHGERVVAFAMTKEEMPSLGVGGVHAGDIFFQLRPDFQLEHANCPNDVTNNGYSVGCVFMMVGAGVEKTTLTRTVRNVDVVPTICHLVGNRMPKDVEGGVIYQALTETK